MREAVDVRTVQEMLGHEDIETTMRYVHFRQEAGEKAIREARRIEKDMVEVMVRKRDDEKDSK